MRCFEEKKKKVKEKSMGHWVRCRNALISWRKVSLQSVLKKWCSYTPQTTF